MVCGRPNAKLLVEFKVVIAVLNVNNLMASLKNHTGAKISTTLKICSSTGCSTLCSMSETETANYCCQSSASSTSTRRRSRVGRVSMISIPTINIGGRISGRSVVFSRASITSSSRRTIATYDHSIPIDLEKNDNTKYQFKNKNSWYPPDIS